LHYSSLENFAEQKVLSSPKSRSFVGKGEERVTSRSDNRGDQVLSCEEKSVKEEFSISEGSESSSQCKEICYL
jgi:hypothetical protein